MERSERPKQILERSSKQVILMPPLSEEAIEQYQAHFPTAVPEDIRELLCYAAGFTHPLIGSVHFAPESSFEFPKAFPAAVQLLRDVSGNPWVVDINQENGAWGAVFFVCHDPPVIVIQAPDLTTFLSQVLYTDNSDSTNALKHVPKGAVKQIWKDDPWSVSVLEARKQQDPVISIFAEQLPENYRIADLRSKKIGSGFSWGLAGPDTDIRRNHSDLIFGIQAGKPGLIKKILTR